LQATITCIDPKQLDRSFAGRQFEDCCFPDGVDPCGERGEFHSCVTAGPMFKAPISTVTGDVVDRDGFVFCDVTLR
jgi:diphthamide synthase (EF-2-diphthine--ammonia ligase)